ncbi:hypothetical protein FACS18942_05330 [Planctomycetales bacterium]|nr:hypothetical protein FACS18942_05330 [Planctomycetales bacterium]
MLVFAFVLQAITGILLWAHYSTSTQSAWESIFYIQFILPGGWMIRGIHHYSAQLFVALLGFYFLALVLHGKYRTPREFVYWCAFGMLLFSLASCLTGDLLTWTLSGYSATLVRVRFLQMLPFVGEPLFKIVAGGPEFGTLTIPRFLVLHLLFGGGMFALLVLWRFFEYKAATFVSTADSDETEKSTAKKPVFVPFWSNEVLKRSLACLLFMAAVLVLNYKEPILHTARSILGSNEHKHAAQEQTTQKPTLLPIEYYRGAHLDSPADPANFYDAARPEWSFRALYHFSNLKSTGKDGKDVDVFPGSVKYLPIFVIPGLLAAYLLIVPVIGHSRPGHYFNVIVILFLFAGFCYLTYASYHHDYYDPAMESFRADAAKAKKTTERAIELCFAPEGIPASGALTLLERDPLHRGAALYEQHCSSCHPFQPSEGEAEHPDFKPIPCESPSAPNLYNPIRKKWLAGFMDAKQIRSDDYYGKTKFAKGSMTDFVRGDLKNILEEDEDNEKILDKMTEILYQDALRPAARAETPRGVEGLTEEQVRWFEDLSCNTCHVVYQQKGKPKIQAPDLRGYMSKEWMIAFIADPSSSRFYGPAIGNRGNDRMPSYYLSPVEATMSPQEIETLVDFIRGNWFRYGK